MKKFKLNSDQRYIMAICGSEDNCENLALTFKIKGALDKERLEKAISKTINENDAFRFKVHKNEKTGELYQGLYDEVVYKLNVRITNGSTYEERYHDANKQILQIASEAKFVDNYLWDFVLFDMKEEEYIFYGRMNHLLFDGLSISLTFANIMANYNGTPLKKGVSYEYYINEQDKFKKTEKYNELVNSHSDMIETMKNYSYVINSLNAGGGESQKEYSYFTKVGGEKLITFCKENKMSLFHVNLFLLHTAIATVYGRRDSAVAIPSGVRDLEYMNTIGSIVYVGWSYLAFTDDMMMRNAAEICRDNYFRNSKASVVVTDTIIENDLPLDFFITYQNHIVSTSKCVSLGDAKVEMITDPTFGREKAEVRRVIAALSALEMDNQATCTLVADKREFPSERALKAYELAVKCLTEQDMTYAEFCNAILG